MKSTGLVRMAAMMLCVAGDAEGSQNDYMLVGPGGKISVVPEQDLAKANLEISDLGHNTYAIAGPSGNISIAVGDDAVLLVDSEYAPLHDKVVAAVAKVAPHPIRTIVLTHYHHTDGIGLFAQNGVVVIAQANVRKRLEEGTARDPLTGFETPPVSAGGLPTETYTDTVTLTLKGRRLQAGHPVNAIPTAIPTSILRTPTCCAQAIS